MRKRFAQTMTQEEMREEGRLLDLMADPYKGDSRQKRDEEIITSLIQNKQPLDYNYMMSVLEKHRRGALSDAIRLFLFPHSPLISFWCGKSTHVVRESIGGNVYMTAYTQVWKAAISFWNQVIVTNKDLSADAALVNELIKELSKRQFDTSAN